jgi:hypothetical protein
MSLAVATVPGKSGENGGRALESFLVELSSGAPAVTTIDLSTLVGPASPDADALAIENRTSSLVRFRINHANPSLNPSGSRYQVIFPGSSHQIAFEDTNPIRSVEFEAVAAPASLPVGQAARVSTLTAIPGFAGEFLAVNFIER